MQTSAVCRRYDMRMHSEATEGSFHDSIGPILRIVQFFGLLPVDNVNSKDISSMNFRWKSMKVMYSCTFLICGLIESILCLRLVVKSGMSLGYSSALSFYFVSLIGACFLFKLAQKWKQLMRIWFESEKVFLKPPYTVHGWPLKRKIRLWAIAIGCSSLCNWMLPSCASVRSLFVSPLQWITHCFSWRRSTTIN